MIKANILSTPARCAVTALLLMATNLSAADIYVNPAASGANNGSSWVNARTSLTAALAAATSGDSVWVVSGTYRPAASGASTSSTFTIPAGVSVYGGLLGFENTLSCRNWQVNKTILSGDLNSNDTGSCYAGNAANRADNCIHVVVGANQARLDGFVVEGGNSVGTSGGGLKTLSANSADPTVGMRVENCWFRNNVADNEGGGVLGIGMSTVITRCIFEDNQARSGGGLYYAGALEISRCIFYRNCAAQAVPGNGGNGGGLVVDTYGPKVANALFLDNRAIYGGATAVLNGATPLFAYLTVADNNTIAEVGTGFSVGGGFFVDSATGTNANIKNSLFQNNKSVNIPSDAYVLSGGALAYYSSLALNAGSDTVYATGNNNFSGVLGFQTISDARGGDGVWFSGDDKYVPSSGSLQLGKAEVLSGATATVDLRGFNRNATLPDSGAYERTGNGSGASQEMGLSSSPNLSVPVIYSSTTAAATSGVVFTYRIRATNMAYAISGSPQGSFLFGISSGTLPTGLSLDAVTGLITGTPSSAGVTNVTVSATNYIGTGTAALVITVTATPAAPAITSTLTASGIVSSAFTYQITGSNTPTSFNATGLPTGLSVNTTTGVISGTPSAVGVTNVTITATNATGSGSGTLVITVTAPPAITSTLTTTGTVGTAFTYQITGSNTPTSFNATGLPAGLTVNTTTGVISGTPTATGVTNVTITATNTTGSGSATLAMTISTVPAITSTLSATGAVGTAFTYQITGSNTPTSFSATGLPAGLSVNTGTGAITGTPTAAGSSTVIIGATNAGGTGTASLMVAISSIAGAPAVTSVLTASGTVGAALSYQITGSNTPTSFSATGLPTGLSVNTTTGVISGTPSVAGATNATITTTNGTGSGSATLVITISAASGDSSPTSSSGGNDCGFGSGGSVVLLFGLFALLEFRRRRY